jgi:hypothetical protein
MNVKVLVKSTDDKVWNGDQTVTKLTSWTSFTTSNKTETLSHNYTQNLKSALSTIASYPSDRSHQDKAISTKQFSKL